MKYRHYTLHFKPSGDLELQYKECQGSIRMVWRTYHHNLYTHESSHQDQELQI